MMKPKGGATAQLQLAPLLVMGIEWFYWRNPMEMP
jgi:hypothetical protein